MRNAILFFFIFSASQWVSAQDCTVHVLVNLFDAKTGHLVRDLQPEYFQAHAGKTPLAVRSVEPMRNNRILVLVDASGAAEEARVAASVNTIADVTQQAPEGNAIGRVRIVRPQQLPACTTTTAAR